MRRLGVVLAVAVSITTVGAEAGTRPQAAGLSLRGTISVRDFVVPRGTTRTIEGNLRVLASRDIVIDGTVLIRGAPNVTLKAGRALKVGPTGRLKPIPTRSTASAHADPIVVNEQSNFQVLGSERVELEGDIEVPPGTSVKIASAEFGSVVLDGSITTMDGNAGSSTEDDGQNAGSISIGGFFGANQTVTIDRATLVAGDGGAGFSPSDGRMIAGRLPCRDNGIGELNRKRMVLRASDGGKGGTIRLMAKETSAIAATITPGRGGDGGDAARRRVQAPKSTSGGVDMIAWAGSGGEGGSIVVQGKYTGAALQAARGGDSGSVRAAAGDGDLGCDGGRTDAILGKPGFNGLNQGKSTKPPRTGGRDGDIVLDDGGTGGRGFTEKRPAGGGGDVTLSIPKPTRKRDVRPNFGGYYFDRIELSGYADGGQGYQGCRSPAEPGGDGGGGAQLFVPARVRYSARLSFRGGNGGDGLPPGDGGPAGAAENKPDSLQGSFQPGTGGKPCPGGLYRFSFGGSAAPALHLSYTVVRTSGNTDAGTFDVLSGTACGEDAATARWTVQQQSSKSGAAQQTVRFSDFNPYPIYLGSYDNAGNIDVKLRLTPGRSPTVGLDVTAPAAFRDIVKTPAQAAITATRVTSCP